MDLLEELKSIKAEVGAADLSNIAPQQATTPVEKNKKDNAPEENPIVAEIKRRAKEKFSDQEIDDIINMGKKLCAKPVLTALIEVIKEGRTQGRDQDEADKLIMAITKTIPYNYCGYIDVTFNEIPYSLNICLSLVDRDYRTEIDIPSEAYVNDLYMKYDMLKQTALAYWQSYISEHEQLVKRVAAYRPDVDFGTLKIDISNKTTLYFDPLSAKRIGIFCYYVDWSGRPFYRKRRTTN